MHLKRRDSGFSLLELTVVVVISMVLAGVAIFQMREAIRNQKSESALQDVLRVTRTARQLAIDKRRVFMVTYTPSTGGTVLATMTLTVTPPTFVLPAGTSPCSLATSVYPDSPGIPFPPTPVQSGFDFAWITGAPTASTGTSAAPDGYGNGTAPSSPISFTTTGNSICFFPDGSARDVNNAYDGGVVYLAPLAITEGNTTTRLNHMRAMSIFGPTGRISSWRLYQTAAGLQWKQ